MHGDMGAEDMGLVHFKCYFRLYVDKRNSIVLFNEEKWYS